MFRFFDNNANNGSNNNYKKFNNFNSNRKFQKNYNYNNNRNNYQRQSYNNNFNVRLIQCYRCNGPHFSYQCNTDQDRQLNYRKPNDKKYCNTSRPSNSNNNFNGNKFQTNNYTRPPTNYNARNIKCNYCNKIGL